MRLKHLVGLLLFMGAGFLYTTGVAQTSVHFSSNRQHFSQQLHKVSQLIVVDKVTSFAEIDVVKKESRFSTDLVPTASYFFSSDNFNSLLLFRGYAYVHSRDLFKLFGNFRI